MSLAALSRFSTPNVRYAPLSAALSGHLTSGYATAASPKGRASTKSTSTKTTKSTKSTKTTKKPRAKKVLTDEQKAAKKEAKEKSDLRQLVKQLKAASLTPPKRLTNHFTLTMLSKLEEVKKEGKGLKGKEAFKEAADRAKNISEAEREVRWLQKDVRSSVILTSVYSNLSLLLLPTRKLTRRNTRSGSTRTVPWRLSKPTTPGEDSPRFRTRSSSLFMTLAWSSAPRSRICSTPRNAIRLVTSSTCPSPSVVCGLRKNGEA